MGTAGVLFPRESLVPKNLFDYRRGEYELGSVQCQALLGLLAHPPELGKDHNDPVGSPSPEDGAFTLMGTALNKALTT
jgi:hypothetical protein